MNKLIKLPLFLAIFVALCISGALSDTFKIPLEKQVEIIVWQGGEDTCKYAEPMLQNKFETLVKNSCKNHTFGKSDSRILFSFNWKIAKNSFGQNINACISPFVIEIYRKIDADLISEGSKEKMVVQQDIYMSSTIHQFSNRNDTLSDINDLSGILGEACRH